MKKAAEAATGGPVLEVELVLAQAIAAADGVDRHPDLHPEARCEGQHVEHGAARQRPLTGQGRLCPQSAAAQDQPAGEADGEAEAAADATAEDRDRELGPALAHRRRERPQALGRGSEIAVAEKHVCDLLVRERSLQRPRHRTPLAERPAAEHLRPRRSRELRRRVGGAVVGDPQRGTGEGAPERTERGGDPLLLVARRDHHRQVRAAVYCPAHVTARPTEEI